MKGLVYTALGAGIVVTVTTLSGCSGNKASSPSTLSELNAQKRAQKAQQEKAQGNAPAATQDAKAAASEFARIGELLLMPEGVTYANQMFDQALAADPTNAKANFYKAWVGPLMQVKGFVPMIQPLVVASHDLDGLERLRENVSTLNMPEVQDFVNTLPAGQKPFSKYYDVQRFIHDTMLPAIQASIANLSAIDATIPVQLNFTPERVKLDPRREEYSYNEDYSQCTYDPSTGWNCTDNSYSGNYDQKKLPNVYFVDQYDLKILRNAMIGLQDEIIVGTAYSSNGIEMATRQLKAVDDIRREAGLPGASAQDIVGVLTSGAYSDLFALEKDQGLGTISGSVADVLRAGIDLANLRDKLCTGTSRNAKNALLFPICIEADVVDQLQTGVNTLAGPTSVTIATNNGSSVSLEMDLGAVLKNPPSDLKALLPTSFDQNGQPVNYDDPTMGGLFPNGDFIAKLEQLVAPASYSDGAARAVRRVVRKAARHL